ncbi:MAG: FtsQ-type POTRA domain-containing protein [Candidatus Aminicenantes bacterium]|jgi:cell division septal protein FtsQ
MATQATSPLRYKANVFVSEPLQFRRKEKKTKPKKVQRRIKLKIRHILVCFFLICGLFILLQRAFLFLISWEKLDVDRIEVTCPEQQIAEDIRSFLEGKYLGNLLILDIHNLKEKLMDHPWIKDIRVRKNFPSTLKISIQERHPAALLKKRKVFLIDREGKKLQEVVSSQIWNLPLFVDSENFAEHTEEKFQLGWKLLDSLDPADRDSIEVVDLTEYGNVKVKLEESSTWIILGGSRFPERMKIYRARKPLFERYGPLEYVDLRLEQRIYIKPQKLLANDVVASMAKEAN